MKNYVLITGSTSGIGKEFVKIFASKGYNLVLTSSKISELKKLKTEISSEYKNIDICIIEKDLSKMDAAKEMYEELTDKGVNVSILINNAGFGYFSKYIDSDINKNNDLLMVNNYALANLSYYFGKEMAKQKYGKILNVASIAAFEGGPYMATYFASKAFVLSFSEALSLELKDDNVTVTCLCPGPTRTNFEKNANLEKSYMFTKLKTDFPKDVALEGYNALMNDKMRVTSGIQNKIAVFLSRFTPRKLNAKIAEYINLGKLKK